MRTRINIMSWIVFLGLLFHMAEGRRHLNKNLVARKTDHPVRWKQI
jgi:hypothetical protein